jgi:fluoride exporter
MTLLLVLIGAGVGGPLRYLTDRVVQTRYRPVLPLGTLAVNLAASLLLGVLVGASGVGGQEGALLDTGFCGSLSTYSTFSYESIRVSEEDGRAAAVLYAGLTVVGGLALATAGFVLGRSIF